jgi:hypothetical protein
MRKTTGFLTNDTNNLSSNTPLLLEPIHQPNNHRWFIGSILIITHTLSFLLGLVVTDMWITNDSSVDGSK